MLRMVEPTRFDELLTILQRSEVNFILIGGLAGMAHGSNRATLDVDVVYDRSPENIRRLVAALRPHDPYPRGAPPGLPFLWDEVTITSGLNFTLQTKVGAIDLLGEATGQGNYENLSECCTTIKIFGTQCQCVTLAKLIELKRAAGRPKDFEAIAELEYLLSQREDEI